MTVHTRRTFAIARSAADAFERVILELEEDGAVGRGEAAPTRYYGQDAASVAEALRNLEIPDPWDIEGALAHNDCMPPTARTALDSALHDLAAKRLGVPLYRLLGLARPEPVSAYTLGIAEPETTVEEARRLSDFPILKMKVGGREDLETVRAVAQFSEAEIWVDANEAFSPDEAPEVAAELKSIGVRVIEQPVPASAGPEALRRDRGRPPRAGRRRRERHSRERRASPLRVRERGQRQARQVRRGARRPGRDPHRPRFGDDRDARVHGRDLAGDLHRRLTSQAS